MTSQQPPIRPEDLLHFIELDGFSNDWHNLGLDDDELARLQLAIMGGGKHAPVIKGTGGLRKLRYAPLAWHTGKSGAIRVCFAQFEEYGIILLVTAYAKSKRDDLTAAEKHQICRLLTETKGELDRRKQSPSTNH